MVSDLTITNEPKPTSTRTWFTLLTNEEDWRPCTHKPARDQRGGLDYDMMHSGAFYGLTMSSYSCSKKPRISHENHVG